KHYSSKSHDIMEGAIWRDPEHVAEWMGDLSKTKPVVTFCATAFTTDVRPPQPCVKPALMPANVGWSFLRWQRSRPDRVRAPAVPACGPGFRRALASQNARVQLPLRPKPAAHDCREAAIANHRMAAINSLSESGTSR